MFWDRALNGGFSYFSFQSDGVYRHTQIIILKLKISTANFAGKYVESRASSLLRQQNESDQGTFSTVFVIAIYFNKFELRINVRKVLKYLVEEMPVRVSQADTK